MEREAEKVGAELCIRAREVGSRFRKPDDDWQAFMLVWRDDAVRALVHVPVPDIELGGGPRNALFQGVVPELIQSLGGTAAAMVQSSWMVMSASPEAAEQVAEYSRSGGSFEFWEGRIEALSVTAADSEGPLQWIARIERDGTSPPTLGEWELWGDSLDGRIAAGLLAGVRG